MANDTVIKRSGSGAALTLEDAQAALALETEKRSISLFRHGTLEVKLFEPRGRDVQMPHTRDEIYVVAVGEGVFFNDGVRQPFRVNDVLFVKAGAVHRFEDF